MRVLLTAFEPYDRWPANSSWMTLVELLKDLPKDFSLVTRRYPVDLDALQPLLKKDLERSFDAVLHLGQAPGASSVKLEAIAINVAGCIDDHGMELSELVPSAPVAYRTSMPMGRWASLLRNEGIPADISYHAGTFLCNAITFLSHDYLHNLAPASQSRNCMVGFVHLPLATEQVAQHSRSMPSLPVKTMARAVRLLLDDLIKIHAQQQVA